MAYSTQRRLRTQTTHFVAELRSVAVAVEMDHYPNWVFASNREITLTNARRQSDHRPRRREPPLVQRGAMVLVLP